MQMEHPIGALAGLGYVGLYKMKDSYKNISYKVKEALEKSTDEKSHFVEARLGYSSLSAFKRKQAAVPATATLDYQHHISGMNTPQKNLVSVNATLFF